jgi:YfiH family protein
MFSSLPTEPVAATEVAHPGSAPIWVHPGWREAYPWLLQGVTARGSEGAPFDLGLFAGGPGSQVLERWAALRAALSAPAAVHARQIHGATVRHHRAGPPGLWIADPCDGHVTRAPGVLLTVAVADCVPVTLLDPATRSVTILHAGWRGTAAGIVEAGLAALRQRLDVGADSLVAHLGPAICGECYEVGVEVYRALGLAAPDGPRPLDLRRVVAQRLQTGGIDGGQISVSTWCTRCRDSPFFSHRGGDGHRQVAFVGVA